VSDGSGGIDTATTLVHVDAPAETTITPPPTTTTPPPPLNPGPPAPGTTTTTIPTSITLGQLINGTSIPITCTSDCTVTGTLDMSASDYKALTSVVRVIRVATGAVKLKAGKKGKLKLKISPKLRKKLKAALASATTAATRKIKLNLTLNSSYKSGKKKKIRRKIILRA
jgi:hypothetical protein